MLHKDDVWTVIQEAAMMEGEALSLASILDSYAPRKTIEVFNFLAPVFRLERWWLRTVKAWLAYHEEHGLDTIANIDFLVAKNRQYGSKQLYMLGTLGIWLRSVDKVERVKTIDSGVMSPILASEPRADSLVDLFNYAILAVLLIRKRVH